MSGGAALNGMINHFKNNKALLKKRKRIYDRKEEFSKMPYQNDKLTFKEPTEQEAAAYHLKIRRQKRFGLVLDLILIVAAIGIIALLIYLVSK